MLPELSPNQKLNPQWTKLHTHRHTQTHTHTQEHIKINRSKTRMAVGIENT